ncbi:hypothetical protein Pla52o_29840 [Novipirellula galeiformis]|uniref:Uncharacterized protein n=1 Tax=Novipirellula galeiformis TaxID=2528004 RepID=A0A5C6CGK0_9BACT|nr:hypothetical protein Pla52o_29840 [Novipirellula galeiformis]
MTRTYPLRHPVPEPPPEVWREWDVRKALYDLVSRRALDADIS